jgi:XRE family transcriptional regulator, regulator of sulfur utilization
MFTRRDLLLPGIALCVGISIGHAAQADSKAQVQESALWDWESLSSKPTGVGQYRHVVRAPTATLDELEMHVTTLNPGQTSHAPHKHPNEELVIIASGKLEATSNGQTKVLGPGSIIFNASNQLHGVRNVGTEPATYHVINWASPGTLKKKAEGEGAKAAPVPAAGVGQGDATKR